MNKERDLLKRWFNEFGRICCNKNLLIETKELLAKRQPEQSSKWWYGKGVEDTMLVLTRKPLSDGELWQALASEQIPDYKTMAFIKGVKWAEAQHGIGVGDE